MPDLFQTIDEWVHKNPRFLDWKCLRLNDSRLDEYPHASQLHHWLERGYHGSMEFMERHLDLRTQIRNLEPQATTVFQFLVAYPEPLVRFEQEGQSGVPKISSYAKGDDYHKYCYDSLSQLRLDIEKAGFSTDVFRNFTDSAPVFERDLAGVLGLGWLGKNACLINKKYGSSFFLTGFVSDLSLASSVDVVPAQDFCGGCTRCIDMCPTSAIESNGVIKASDCISYWSIEHKGKLSQEQGAQLSDWIYGCDICQQVCPWNHKEIQLNQEKESAADWPHSASEWISLLGLGGGFKSKFKTTALYRGGRKKLLRNLFWFARNRDDIELKTLCLEVAHKEADDFQQELLGIFDEH